MIHPQQLQKRDKVAIVAPSLSAKKDTVNRAVKTVRAMGLDPVVYQSCYMVNDCEDAAPDAKAQDINAAFGDRLIKGVIALRAGHGTMALLGLLDYDLIGANPKVFMGFSDITGMHLALHKRCNMVTFHGPLATTNIRVKTGSGTEIEPITHEYLNKCLFVSKPLGIVDHPAGEELRCLSGGRATGQLLGGNLTLLVQTLGTAYEIDAKGKVLFIEDMGESLTAIASMLRQLAEAGVFSDCEGIVLGN